MTFQGQSWHDIHPKGSMASLTFSLWPFQARRALEALLPRWRGSWVPWPG